MFTTEEKKPLVGHKGEDVPQQQNILKKRILRKERLIMDLPIRMNKPKEGERQPRAVQYGIVSWSVSQLEVVFVHQEWGM